MQCHPLVRPQQQQQQRLLSIVSLASRARVTSTSAAAVPLESLLTITAVSRPARASANLIDCCASFVSSDTLHQIFYTISCESMRDAQLYALHPFHVEFAGSMETAMHLSTVPLFCRGGCMSARV